MTDDALKLPTPRTEAEANKKKSTEESFTVWSARGWDFARQLESACRALALAIELQYPHKKAIQQYNDLLGDAQGISGKVFARIFELESQLADEQKAHESIASICFQSGAESADGTSIAAVKNLADKLAEARKDSQRLTEYTTHKPECEATQTYGVKCSCGLDDILHATPPNRKEN